MYPKCGQRPEPGYRRSGPRPPPAGLPQCAVYYCREAISKGAAILVKIEVRNVNHIQAAPPEASKASCSTGPAILQAARAPRVDTERAGHSSRPPAHLRACMAVGAQRHLLGRADPFAACGGPALGRQRCRGVTEVGMHSSLRPASQSLRSVTGHSGWSPVTALNSRWRVWGSQGGPVRLLLCSCSEGCSSRLQGWLRTWATYGQARRTPPPSSDGDTAIVPSHRCEGAQSSVHQSTSVW